MGMEIMNCEETEEQINQINRIKEFLNIKNKLLELLNEEERIALMILFQSENCENWKAENDFPKNYRVYYKIESSGIVVLRLINCNLTGK